MVIFRHSRTKSLKADTFLKKTLKLSNKDIIGSGGYGTVYKLVIDEETSFAVKRLNRGSPDLDRGFERELEAMGDIKHRNIVTLYGYYTSPHYNLLIYELMPNGSLDAYLYATFMEPDKTHVSTVVAGTFGYLAPEYFDTGKATAKGDVYSFGVVLLELLTGRKPIDEAFLEEGTKLVTWVKAVVQEKREEDVLDSSLELCPIKEVNSVFSIALMCLETEPLKRPTMADIVKMLEKAKSDGKASDVSSQTVV
ncbi:hypothetical protein BVRB_4g095170 [Beta vulgaris subsp. vulgaris]|uniref:Protein kinase domain-containing protein n=1 Tax=Beta vulgaris subsp. vulgaris TaxID=3555 RepID=A0A0J8B9Z4_BETVV|nr:hypothetical protein BVRB_4g095170 [Beta vulgaris subsp. vulgaris]